MVCKKSTTLRSCLCSGHLDFISWQSNFSVSAEIWVSMPCENGMFIWKEKEEEVCAKSKTSWFGKEARGGMSTQRTTHTKAQGSVHWFQALWLHSSTELCKKGCVHGLEWRNVLMISLALLGFDGGCIYVISLHHFCHFSVALSFISEASLSCTSF